MKKRQLRRKQLAAANSEPKPAIDALTQEIAKPSLTGIRQNIWPTVASGLTPERLAAIVLAVDQNDPMEYLTLAEEMEERDLHYHSVLSTRKLAVSGLNGVVEATSDDAEEVQITEELQQIVDSAEFSNMVADQLDALGKGFACTEIVWDRSGSVWWPAQLIQRDQRFFQFDVEEHTELRLRDEADPVNGVELAPYKWIQHRPRIKTGLPIRGGLARLAVVSFLCKGYALKDWLAFAEVFGMPLRLGKYGTGATPDQKAALLRAVADIGIDAAAIIPDSMAIEFVSNGTSSGGDKLFAGLADYLDKQVSKGVLGQTATTEGTPGKLGADAEQGKVREDIRDDDAKKLAATIRRDLIQAYVDLNYGPRKPHEYPKFRWQIEEEEDLESLSRSLPPFISLGLRVEESVIRDKFGLPEPEEGAQILGAPARPAAPSVPGAEDNPSPHPTPQVSETEQDEKDEQDEQDGVMAALTARILAGETLTQDQRLLLQLAAAQPKDDVERLTGAAIKQWEAPMSPLLEPIIALAAEAQSYEEFLASLYDLNLDSSKLAQAIAVLAFKGRGLGDVVLK